MTVKGEAGGEREAEVGLESKATAEAGFQGEGGAAAEEESESEAPAHRLGQQLLLGRADRGGGVGVRHEAHARGGASERRLRPSQAGREALRRSERENEEGRAQLHFCARGSG